MGKRPPLYHHEEGLPEFQGVRRTRLSSKALKAIENCLIGPAWAPTDLHHETRKALREWGLAEFMDYGTYNPRKTKGGMPIVLGRLTPEGVQVRDDYHCRQAEKLDARRAAKKPKRKPGWPKGRKRGKKK